jgi:hypothetical protein
MRRGGDSCRADVPLLATRTPGKSPDSFALRSGTVVAPAQRGLDRPGTLVRRARALGGDRSFFVTNGAAKEINGRRDRSRSCETGDRDLAGGGHMNAEQMRLAEAHEGKAAWKKWGPYLSERQWGTVREDYSNNGDAWNFFTHDHARSRAYRWGEDGLGGISDDKQHLCFDLALWNGKDPILKERLFGLTNSEGNHGEDVKEYYFYLDSTPTRSYMKFLYKYFHGDNGAGLGASHQTGWTTGAVAKLIQLFGVLDAAKLLEEGKAAAFSRERSQTAKT